MRPAGHGHLGPHSARRDRLLQPTLSQRRDCDQWLCLRQQSGRSVHPAIRFLQKCLFEESESPVEMPCCITGAQEIDHLGNRT